MCNVWQFPDRRHTELTPDELFRVLSDPLFKSLRHWGIAGGEPFLRKDLADMVEAGLRALPGLQTLTISTHAYHTKRMKEVTPIIEELCNAHGVRLRFSISLDGVGEVHNRVRGISGAFQRTWRSIQWIRDETSIDLVIGATLSPYNVNEAFDLWHFCVREGIPTDFRIATVIERLGNRNLKKAMSLNGRDEYTVAELFENLAHHTATPVERRFFYLSLRRSLTENVPRFAICRFKEEGAFLNEQGDLHHCAVYGQAVGNMRDVSGERLMFSDNGETLRKQMVQNACTTCVHDYRTRIPLREVVDFYLEKHKVKAAVKLAYHAMLAYFNQFAGANTPRRSHGAPHFLVIGWYGTETAGDKAILGGIMKTLRDRIPNARFTVVSSLAFYTRNTVEELGAQAYCSVITYDYRRISQILSEVGAVIVGGGPLMDLIEIFDLIRIFNMAREQGVRTVITGVGIGPLKRRLMWWGVRQLLILADGISVRDSHSKRSAVAMGVPANKIAVGTDPSMVYLNSICPAAPDVNAEPVTHNMEKHSINHATYSASESSIRQLSAPPLQERRPQIGLAVRDWPRKYATRLTEAAYLKRRDWLVQFWADLVDRIDETFDVDVSLIPMNTLHIGGDDRWLHLDIRRKARHTDRIQTHSQSYTAEQIAALIKRCTILVGMRFHSVVFGTMQSIPTIAVDYTQGGGKVTGYMHELGMADYVISIDDLDLDVMLNRISRMWLELDELKMKLDQQNKRLLPLAEKTVLAPLGLESSNHLIESPAFFSGESLRKQN